MVKQAVSHSLRAVLLAILGAVALAVVSPPAHGRAKERQGKEVVEAVCAGCHQPGKDGAPKIGDRAAWTPRLAKGLEELIDASVYGHGGMPSRGGMPQLERGELRSAILYMFNYGLPPAVPPPEMAAKSDPRHKLVSGTDIYLGVMRADAVRASQSDGGGGLVKVKVPSGKDYYHVNISLADKASGAPLKDAKVTLRVSDGMSVQSKSLDLLAANNTVSYGEFFRLSSGSAYNIQAEIRRPGASAIVTNFEYRAP